MTTLYYDADADLARLDGRRVAIIGYGSQGHAHALNLRDSGVDVVVGLREDSKSRARPEGRTRGSRVRDATAKSQLIMILTPDTGQARLYCDHIQPALSPGKTLLFAHGFNIRFGEIVRRRASTSAWSRRRRRGIACARYSRQGGGVPALVAVHQDASGHALDDALAYAKGIGCTRAGVLMTTFAEETETDLFGEQAVLCGGVSALVKAAFETLVEAGYQPEVAYFECLHELKLIVDLMYQGGLNYMRYSVSRHGRVRRLRGGAAHRRRADAGGDAKLLAEMQDGSFAREWIAENERACRDSRGRARPRRAPDRGRGAIAAADDAVRECQGSSTGGGERMTRRRADGGGGPRSVRSSTRRCATASRRRVVR